jgi:hypothetical protein
VQFAVEATVGSRSRQRADVQHTAARNRPRLAVENVARRRQHIVALGNARHHQRNVAARHTDVALDAWHIADGARRQLGRHHPRRLFRLPVVVVGATVLVRERLPELRGGRRVVALAAFAAADEKRAVVVKQAQRAHADQLTMATGARARLGGVGLELGALLVLEIRLGLGVALDRRVDVRLRHVVELDNEHNVAMRHIGRNGDSATRRDFVGREETAEQRGGGGVVAVKVHRFADTSSQRQIKESETSKERLHTWAIERERDGAQENARLHTVLPGRGTSTRIASERELRIGRTRESNWRRQRIGERIQDSSNLCRRTPGIDKGVGSGQVRLGGAWMDRRRRLSLQESRDPTAFRASEERCALIFGVFEICRWRRRHCFDEPI